jgi:hypothetical protein
MNHKAINVLLFFTFACLICCINCQFLKIIQTRTKLVASAIVETIDKFYIQGHRQLRVRIYGEITPHLSDVIEIIGAKVSQQAPLLIEHFPRVSKKNCIFERSAVILVSTTKTLNKIKSLAELNNRGEWSFRFIIYCEDLGSNLPNLKWPAPIIIRGHMIFHEYFVVNTDHSIKLMTMRFFTMNECSIGQLIKVDTFNITTEKWHFKMKSAENGKNFHGCLITTVINIRAEGYYVKFGKKEERGGIVSEIHEIMATVGNFTPHYQLAVGEKKIPDSANRTINLFISYHITSILTSNNFVQASFTKEFFFALTPSEHYTNYEKIMFPFDMTSWILFAIFFGLTLVAIAVINTQPRETRVIIYGAGIETPTYNVFGAFFGISQMRLPSENCPRILLTFFIYLCLIFRTCYQGRMFDFMTSDMTKPDPVTTDELIDRDYTIYSTLSVYTLMGTSVISRAM